MPPPSLERLSETLRHLIPLLKKTEKQNVEIQLLKQRVDNLEGNNLEENDLTEFKLELEKENSKVKQKLVAISILEKVAIGVIIYHFTKG